MRKFIKAIIIILVIFVILLGVLFFFLKSRVSEHTIKPILKEAIMNYSGMDARIDGNVELSIFPNIGIRITRVTLKNPAGFPSGNFASVGEMDVAFKLIPLMRRQIVPAKVILKDASLNVIKNTQGHYNWMTSSEHPDHIQNQLNEEVSDEHKEAAKSVAFKLDGMPDVNIEKTYVSYEDMQTNQKYIINDINVGAQEIASKTHFPFHLSFNYLDEKNKVSSHVDLQSKFMMDIQKQSIDMQNSKLTVELTNAQMDQPIDVDVSGDFNVVYKENQESITGNIDLQPFNLKQFCDALQMSTQGVNVPNRASGNVVFSYQPDHLNVQDVDVRLGDMEMQGNVDVKSIENYQADFKVKLNKLDLDELLGDDKSQSSTAKQKTVNVQAQAGSGSTKSAPNEQSDILKKLQLTGGIKVGSLTMSDLDIHQISIKMNSKNGVYQFNPISAKAYGGNIKANATMNMQGSKPRYSLSSNLSNMEVESLLEDLTGKAEVKGLATVNTNISTSGEETSEYLSNLNGKIDFKVTKGSIVAVNLLSQIHKALNLITKKAFSFSSGGSDTSFQSFSGNANISNGVAATQVSLTSDAITANGSGPINLVNKGINMRVNANYIALKDISEITIPLVVSGTYDNPKVSVDMVKLPTAIIKSQGNVIKKQLDKNLKKLNVDDVKKIFGN
ncbi:MAG: AsmA family protein [Gammaproteobacteria bacterium]